MTTIESAVLFSDIEASTQRWERHPDEMRVALERHDAVMAAAFSGAGIRIVKHTGDGVVVAAPDVAVLVAAAVEAQRQLAGMDWAGVGGLAVRMGIHVGRFHERGGDLFGPDMNLAARMMTAAAGGQIVASSAGLVGVTLPVGCAARELGQFRFRGVLRPHAVSDLRYPGAPSFVPYDSGTAEAGNLPAHERALFGREAEFEALITLIRAPGLVTIVGPGGVGKTTAALVAAGVSGPSFPDGRWFVDLTAANADDAVVPLLANVLGLQTSTDDSAESAIAQAISGRSMLVVLDNGEHVIEGVRAALRSIVGVNPRTTVVVTSRESTGHPAERIVRLGPLALDAVDGPAVELFVERAGRGGGEYRPGPTERAKILELCRRLDGIPLAIELAASRMSTLSLDDIVAHLGQRFRLLQGPGSGRHDALEKAIAWSLDQLDRTGQEVVRRVSVFDGEFDATHAAVACGLDVLDVADVLGELVRKSILSRQPGAVPRFRLLESIRQLASARLDAAGERASAHERIIGHVRGLIRRAGADVDGPDQLAWFDRFDGDMPLIRITLQTLPALDPHGAVDMMVSTYQFWMARASRHDALRWLSAALDEVGSSADDGVIASGLAAAATFAFFCGHLGVRELCDRSIAVSEAAGVSARPTAFVRLAGLEVAAGDPNAALAMCERALEVLHADHHPREPPETAAAIGAMFALGGRSARGIEVCEAAIASHAAPSPTTLVSDSLNLGFAYLAVDPARAADAFLAARDGALESSLRFYEATATMYAGLARRAQGLGQEALALLADALLMARDLGMNDESITMIKAVAAILRRADVAEAVALRMTVDQLLRTGRLDRAAELERAVQMAVDAAADMLRRISDQAAGAAGATVTATSGSNDAPSSSWT